MSRRSLSKSTRFEILKRDSFKCQYCGESAPSVLLEVDHITPVSKGGKNHLSNLITACASCNRGKGAIPLSDSAALTKSKAQLDELQARREQIEMMASWHRGLADLDSNQATEAARLWSSLCKSYSLNSSGIQTVRRLISKFGFGEVMRAMRASCAFYLKTDAEGRPTSESASVAFSKLGGICFVAQKEQRNPDTKDLYSIRAMLRARCPYYFNDGHALAMLESANMAGFTPDQIRECVAGVKCWNQFTLSMETLRAPQ